MHFFPGNQLRNSLGLVGSYKRGGEGSEPQPWGKKKKKKKEGEWNGGGGSQSCCSLLLLLLLRMPAS